MSHRAPSDQPRLRVEQWVCSAGCHAATYSNEARVQMDCLLDSEGSRPRVIMNKRQMQGRRGDGIEGRVGQEADGRIRERQERRYAKRRRGGGGRSSRGKHAPRAKYFGRDAGRVTHSEHPARGRAQHDVRWLAHELSVAYPPLAIVCTGLARRPASACVDERNQSDESEESLHKRSA